MTVFIAKLHKSWLPYLAPEPIRYRSHIQNSPSFQQPWVLLHLLPPFPSSPSKSTRASHAGKRTQLPSPSQPSLPDTPKSSLRHQESADNPPPKGLLPHAMAWLKFTDTPLRTTKGRQPRERQTQTGAQTNPQWFGSGITSAPGNGCRGARAYHRGPGPV